MRNFDSYGDKVGALTDYQKAVLCDPQTSGGLLVAVKPESERQILDIAQQEGIEIYEIGKLIARRPEARILVEIR